MSGSEPERTYTDEELDEMHELRNELLDQKARVAELADQNARLLADRERSERVELALRRRLDQFQEAHIEQLEFAVGEQQGLLAELSPPGADGEDRYG